MLEGLCQRNCAGWWVGSEFGLQWHSDLPFDTIPRHVFRCAGDDKAREMIADTSEKNFEASIEVSLLRDPLSSGPKDVSALAEAPTAAYLPGGYHRLEPTDYEKEFCLIPKDVLDFIHATQPKE